MILSLKYIKIAQGESCFRKICRPLLAREIERERERERERKREREREGQNE